MMFLSACQSFNIKVCIVKIVNDEGSVFSCDEVQKLFIKNYWSVLFLSSFSIDWFVALQSVCAHYIVIQTQLSRLMISFTFIYINKRKSQDSMQKKYIVKQTNVQWTNLWTLLGTILKFSVVHWLRNSGLENSANFLIESKMPMSVLLNLRSSISFFRIMLRYKY